VKHVKQMLLSLRWPAGLFAVTLATGCALLSRGEPLKVNYFDPEPPLSGGGAADAGAEVPDCALALGRISASEDLGQEIEFRSSTYQVGFYDARRWTETPDRYLARALQRALFEDGALVRITSGVAPTLDVELVAFEEKQAPEMAHVAVRMSLHDERAVLHEETIDVTRPVGAGGGFDRFVHVMSDVLQEVVRQVAEQVHASLPRCPRR